MSDVELVIKLNEKTYNDIKDGKVYSSVRDVPQESILAIANGIPITKGHGRLIDADDIDNHIIGYVDTRSCPTIIDVDKAKAEVSRNLCVSCKTSGCIFQSGIVRKHCDFYKGGK